MQERDKKEIQKKWTNLYSSCSFDGFHYIFETQGLMKVFWILVVCAATALAIALFFGNIVEFLDYSTSTTLEEVLESEKVPFPTVTICNLNAVSRRKLEKNLFGLTESGIVAFYQELRDGKLDMSNKTIKAVIDTFQRNNITGPGEFMKLYEYTVDEMLLNPHLLTVSPAPCKFIKRDCTEDDFNQVISSNYGLCYQFNSVYSKGEQLYTSKAGEGAGLRLFLNIDEEDLLVSSVPFNGFQLFIHPYGEPFESAIAKRIPVGPGTMDFIHIEHRTVSLVFV